MGMLQAMNKIKGLFIANVGEFKEGYLQYCHMHITEIEYGVISIDAELPNPYYKAPRTNVIPADNIQKLQAQVFCDEFVNSGKLHKLYLIVAKNPPKHGIRYGQNLMNQLSAYDMAAYREIDQTPADCFNDDMKGGAFWAHLSEYYERNP